MGERGREKVVVSVISTLHSVSIFNNKSRSDGFCEDINYFSITDRTNTSRGDEKLPNIKNGDDEISARRLNKYSVVI